MQQTKLSEILAIDTKTDHDIFEKAQIGLVRELAKFVSFPFVRKVDEELRGIMADTVGIFTDDGKPDASGNPTEPQKFPEALQSAWASMIERFGAIINIMVNEATIYSIARKEPETFPELKQKATAEFDKIAREPLMAIVKVLQQLKTAGLDINPYKNLLQTTIRRTMVDDVFKLGARDLENLLAVTKLNPAIKAKLAGVIKDKARTFLAGGTGRQAAVTAPQKKRNIPVAQPAGGIPQTNPDAELGGAGAPQTPATIQPQIAQTIATGFRQYMEKLKADYGVESLKLISQEIQNYLQSNPDNNQQ